MRMRSELPFWIMSLAVFGVGCAKASNSRAPSPSPISRGASFAEPVREPAPEPSQPTSVPFVTSTQARANASSVSPMLNPLAPLAYPGILPSSETTKKLIHIKTNKGEIVFQLLPTEGPRAASNFVYLVTRKFYDGLTFHRVVPRVVIQGGDPLGNGTGGPGYQFEDDPVPLPYTEGIVAMANAGPNTNGSQFFIMLADNPLPPQYSIFGRVVSGMEIVKQIQIGDRMQTVTIERSK